MSDSGLCERLVNLTMSVMQAGRTLQCHFNPQVSDSGGLELTLQCERFGLI